MRILSVLSDMVRKRRGRSLFESNYYIKNVKYTIVFRNNSLKDVFT